MVQVEHLQLLREVQALLAVAVVAVDIWRLEPMVHQLVALVVRVAAVAVQAPLAALVAAAQS